MFASIFPHLCSLSWDSSVSRAQLRTVNLIFSCLLSFIPQPCPQEGTKCRGKDVDVGPRQTWVHAVTLLLISCVILSKASLPLCLGFLPSDGGNIITSTTQRVIEIMDIKVLINRNEWVYDKIILLLILTAGQLIYGLKGYDSNGEISIGGKSARHSSLLALMTRIL